MVVKNDNNDAEYTRKRVTDGKQSIFVSERKRIKVGGVNDIVFFSDREILLDTSLGELHIVGSEMKIAGMNASTGDAEISGWFDGCEYVGRSGSHLKKGKRGKLRDKMISKGR